MSKPNTAEYEARLALAEELADLAKTITLPAYRAGAIAKNKAGGTLFDPVTQADTDTEAAIRAAIEARFPSDGILGEEFPEKPTDNNWQWCLDPIDGTRAFVAAVPVWSTLIAVNYSGKPVIGIIDLPALDERYVGANNKAWRFFMGQKQILESRKCARINDVLLACTEPMAMFSPGERAAYEMIRRTARFTRLGLDAYGFALTAAGKLDLVIESGLRPYDVQALIPVIEGAGGAITNWHGGPASGGGAIVCAGDPSLLEQIYPYLRRAMNS